MASEPTNLERAGYAEDSIRTFMRKTDCDREDALADLLGDLRHWADVYGFDFDRELGRGYRNYADELHIERKEKENGI